MANKRVSFFAIALTAFITITPYAKANQAFDAADKLPADTLLYVGWSQIVDEDTSTIVNDAITKLSTLERNTVTRLQIRQAAKFITSLAQGSGGIGLVKLSSVEQLPEIHVAGVLDAGEDTIALGTTIRQMLVRSPNDSPELVVIGGKSFQKFHLEGLPIVWGVHDGVLITAMGIGNIEATVEQILSNQDKLAVNPRFQTSRAKCDGTNVPQCCIFADVDVLLKAFNAFREDSKTPMPAGFDDTLAASGIQSVRSLYVGISDHDYGVATRIHTQLQGPKTGLLTCWDVAPLSVDDLRIIPKNAMWSGTRNIEINSMVKTIVDFVGVIDSEFPQMFDTGMATADAQLGFSIREDLLASLGDTWIAYDSPDHGGFLGSGKVYVIDVTNREKLEMIADKLIALANDKLKRFGVTLKPTHVEKDGQRTDFVVADGFPIPIAPAAAFVNDKLIVGLFPQPVAMAAARVKNPRVGGCILDHPDIRRVLKSMPPNIISFSTSDNARIREKLFGIEHLLMTAAASYVASEEFNPGTLPTLPEASQSWSSFVGGTIVTDDEIYFSSYGWPLGSIVPQIDTLITPISFFYGHESKPRHISTVPMRKEPLIQRENIND